MVPTNLSERRRIVSYSDGKEQNSSLEFKDTVPVKAKVGLHSFLVESLPHRWWNVVILIATLTLVFTMRLSFWSKWICWTFLAAASLFGSSMVPEPGFSLRVALFGAQCDKPGVSTSTSGQCLFQSQMDNTVKGNTQELAR